MRVVYHFLSVLVCFWLPTVIAVEIVGIILLNPWFYISYNENNKDYKIEESLGIDKDVVYEALSNMLFYVSGRIDNPQLEFNQSGSKVAFYNERELSHMYDIRRKVHNGQVVCIIGCFLALISLITLIKGKQKELIKGVYPRVLLIEAGFIIFTAVAYIIRPIFVITLFHKIFFKDNSWIFNPVTDRIIYFFPNGIYARIILVISLAIVCTNALFVMISRIKITSQRAQKRV